MTRIGIPRALLYYQYYLMWKAFFEHLGAEVVVSEPTTRATLIEGAGRVVADTCLPAKVFVGHVVSLVGQCDCIFIPAIRSLPALLTETAPREATILTGALQEDVDAGRASQVGQSIRKPHRIEATGVFFEDVVRSDPADPDSPLEGRGRFHAEIWVLSWLGIDFAQWSKAQLVATRFFFDALFPFVLLFAISPFTRPVDKAKNRPTRAVGCRQFHQHRNRSHTKPCPLWVCHSQLQPAH